MLQDDMYLTLDEDFDPEPHIDIKNFDFIKRLLVMLPILVVPPYDLVNRLRTTIVRSDANLKNFLRILSLGRFTKNGELEKLSVKKGFKHTLVELDNILIKCPRIMSCVNDVAYQVKVDKRVNELEIDETKEIQQKTEKKQKLLKVFE